MARPGPRRTSGRHALQRHRHHNSSLSFYVDGYGLRAAYRGFDYPTYEGYPDVGFRVSEVPEPVSAAVLLVGGLFLTRRRVRRT